MAVSTESPIKTQVRTIDGLSIRYAESEPRDVSAVLLSPWPESLYTFEQMWSRLAEHAHLVAIDLPGFGHSERRNELLTSRAMGEFVAHLVDEFQLERPHAVGPDIGTSTLLFTAANHPHLLRSIVIGNGTAAVPLQIGSVLKDVVEAPDLEGDRFVESIRFVRSYADELPVPAGLLGSIETPVQIITGEHDPGVLPVNGMYLAERLPHSKHDFVDAGHFAWADAVDDYARLIIDWWDGGYERV
jgi:pimeloyl-ACP methyl ester carboxylesterase